MNFHFIRYLWNELCGFICPSLWRGDIKHTTSVRHVIKVYADRSRWWWWWHITKAHFVFISLQLIIRWGKRGGDQGGGSGFYIILIILIPSCPRKWRLGISNLRITIKRVSVSPICFLTTTPPPPPTRPRLTYWSMFGPSMRRNWRASNLVHVWSIQEKKLKGI